VSEKKIVVMPKEEYDRLEAAWKDEKMRADTISSRIQGVNDALLVADARNNELRSIIYDIGVGWSKEDDGPITRALNRYNKMELEK
tara:strand:- start:29628 stop:29885 length:258 start_codon:yes stop_codon:yes gene_type:complete